MARHIDHRVRHDRLGRLRPATVVAAAFGAATAVDLVALRTPPGAGLALGALLVVAIVGAGSLRPQATLGIRLATLAAAAIAVMIAVRSSEALLALNVAGVLGLCLVVLGSYASRPPAWGLASRLGGAIMSAGAMLRHASTLLRVVVGAASPPERLRRFRPVLVGLVLAVPVLAVFVGLFASADVVFAGYVDRFFNLRLDAGDELFHAVAVAVIGFGLLGAWALGVHRDAHAAPNVPSPALPAATAVTMLGLVVALFATFVLVQVTYLFGGNRAIVEGAYTYAEYARRGFFELVAVAGLVLGLLLVTDWLVHANGVRRRSVDALAATLIALTYVVVASAMRRMALYVDTFGLTELRLYTTAFMLWIAVVLTWFALTVLRGDRNRFGAGFVAACVVLVLGLNAVNPDAVIVAVDVDRHTSGQRELDGNYVASLGPDAVPALMAPVTLQRCDVVSGLAGLRSELERQAAEEGWRTATLADLSAIRLLDSSEFAAAEQRCS